MKYKFISNKNLIHRKVRFFQRTVIVIWSNSNPEKNMKYLTIKNHITRPFSGVIRKYYRHPFVVDHIKK